MQAPLQALSVAGPSVPIREETAGWHLTALADPANGRLYVQRYAGRPVAALTRRLKALAREHGLDKVVVLARAEDWQAFLARGFVLEGVLDGYFRGAPAYALGYFLTGARRSQRSFEQEQTVLEAALAVSPEPPPALPSGCRLMTPAPEQAAELAAVFRQVFETYPTPLYDARYVAKLIKSGEGVFRAVVDGGQVVSAAAAELVPEWGSAEMTNCATLPEYRGAGFMRILLGALEADAAALGIGCLFSIARATSLGMNLALRKAGYAYRGRQVNNCHICGGFEDMNLWVKRAG